MLSIGTVAIVRLLLMWLMLLMLLMLFMLLQLMCAVGCCCCWVAHKATAVLTVAAMYNVQTQGSANQPLLNREIAVAVANDCCCL